MKVRDVMETKVVSIAPSTTYEEAAKMMHENRLSGLPVVDSRGALIGMVSEKDLFRALFPKYEEFLAEIDETHNQESQEDQIEALRKTPIVSYMHHKVLTVSPDAPILRAGGLMLAHGIHRLPVIEGDRLIGIVSREDIYTAVLKHHLGF